MLQQTFVLTYIFMRLILLYLYHTIRKTNGQICVLRAINECPNDKVKENGGRNYFFLSCYFFFLPPSATLCFKIHRRYMVRFSYFTGCGCSCSCTAQPWLSCCATGAPAEALPNLNCQANYISFFGFGEWPPKTFPNQLV